MSIYDWTQIFGDMGKVIKTSNEIEGFIETLESRELEIQSQFSDDIYDVDYSTGILTSTASFRATMRGNIISLSTGVNTYIIATNLLRAKIKSAFSSTDDVILQMIDRMNEDIEGYPSEGQTIKGNLVTVGPDYSETGDSFDQISGYSGLRGFTSDMMDSGMNTYFKVIEAAGWYTIEIYKDAALGISDLIGHTIAYNTTGSKTIIPDNNSGLRGTIVADSVAGTTTTITVTWSWNGIREGDGVIEEFAATQMGFSDDMIVECISVSTVGSEQWRIRTRTKGQIGGNSGLVTTGEVFPAEDVQDLAGIELLITAGATDFVVGDRFELTPASDDDGVFQTYFRDYFSRFLPNVLDGTETISDSLAQ